MSGDGEGRGALIAAAVILAVFGVGAFYMPTIMLALGETSPAIAGVVAVLFVAAFFAIFWLRGRARNKER